MSRAVLPGDLLVVKSTNPGSILIQPVDPTAGQAFGDSSLYPTGAYMGSRVEAWLSPDGNYIGTTTGSTGAQNFRGYPIDGGNSFLDPVATIAGSAIDCSWRPGGGEVAVSHSTSPFVTRLNVPAMTAMTTFGTIPTATADQIEYSPDGTKLAVGFNASPWLIVYDLTTDTPVTLGTALSGRASGLAWSPDGTKLACANGTGNPVVYDTSTWTSTALAGGSWAGSTKRMRWSPDGSRLMGLSSTSSANPRVWDMSGGGAGVVIANPSGYSGVARTDGKWIDGTTAAIHNDAVDIIDYSTSPATIIGRSLASGVTAIEVIPGLGRRWFGGSVVDVGLAAAERTIRAVNRRSGRVLAETRSAVDGSFELPVWTTEPAIVYCVGESGETTKLFDNVTPVATLPP